MRPYQPCERLNLTSDGVWDGQRHLSVPVVKSPLKVGRSPLFGDEPKPRTTLLFFRGDFRSPEVATVYSRGIRQRLRALAQKHGWEEKYKIVIGTGRELRNRYDDYLMTSKFCLVVPGTKPGAGQWGFLEC